MDGAKKEKKDADSTNAIDDPAEENSSLDGKKLHDLYRHTTKLIK